MVCTHLIYKWKIALRRTLRKAFSTGGCIGRCCGHLRGEAEGEALMKSRCTLTKDHGTLVLVSRSAYSSPPHMLKMQTLAFQFCFKIKFWDRIGICLYLSVATSSGTHLY